MLGWQPRRDTVRPQLGGHAALDAHAPADLDDLVRAQLGEAEAAQRLHMHENVRCAFATGEKSKATDPIEPLHPSPFPVALGNHLHVRALRQLRGVNGRALVHAEHAEGLQPARPLEHLAVHPGTFVGGLVAPRAEAGDVQQHVGKPIVGDDEAITLRYVEPLDLPGDFEDLDARVRPCLRVSCFPLFIRIVRRRLRFLLYHTGTPALPFERLLLPVSTGADLPSRHGAALVSTSEL